MSLIALGLQIPDSLGGKDYFKAMHDYDTPSGCVCRLLFYPPLPEEFGDAEEGCVGPDGVF
jgi:hypothetical protein